MTPITADELKLMTRYIYEISGIHLDASKSYLIETRLKGLMKASGTASYYQLYRKAKADAKGVLKGKIIDAVGTQETMFFRDRLPFELLENRLLPELIKRKGAVSNGAPATVRIWSAGCSTGQELYSIAMVLKASGVSPPKFDVRLLGTDISESALSGARSGEYSQVLVERGLPKEKLTTYFNWNGRKWRIRDDIRSLCTFRKHNLMEPLRGLGRFDIVFCRNVAIYFRPRDKAALFDKLATVLDPDGRLIIGSSESISGTTSKFEPVTRSSTVFYQLKNSASLVPQGRAF